MSHPVVRIQRVTTVLQLVLQGSPKIVQIWGDGRKAVSSISPLKTLSEIIGNGEQNGHLDL